MHKTPTQKKFVIVSRKCSTKTLSKAVTIDFKLILKHFESFLEKSHFGSDYKTVWVDENSKNVIDRLDQINIKQNANFVSTFDLSTLYNKLPQKDLLKVLFDLIDFGFTGGSKKKN